ncbi:MAG TPA: hypothetical protein VI138_06990 [Candidatus Dormibacteraeota bacterium]
MVVLIVIVVVVVAGIIIALFGWDRYRGGRSQTAAAGAHPTDEVFIEPDTGRRMRVWFNPDTGQREYRPE